MDRVIELDRAVPLPELARHHARTRAASSAILDGATIVTWADLDRTADAIAGLVASAGHRPGERVGLAIGQTALGVAALHGVPRAGVSPVLVHPRRSPQEAADVLHAAGCRGVLLDPAVQAVVPAGFATTVIEPRVVLGSGEPPPASMGSTDGELIVPTSGTTTKPRLARLPFDRIAASAASWTGFLPPATGWLLSLGLAHVAGIGIVTRAALAGVPVVVPDGAGVDELLAAIEGARRRGVVVSHLSLVATQLAAMLDTRAADRRAPDGLRAVILGGGPIPPDLVRRAVRAGWPVVPSYGMTETASGVVALPAVDAGEHASTVGRPLPGVELRIDPDARIAVRGPMVFAGYLDDPEATAMAGAPDGWVRTGDLGQLDGDGRLTVLGRADDTIITGGENVAPAAIEAALRDHPAVGDAAVIGVADPTWGAVPIAVVVIRPGADVTDDALRSHVRGHLASFAVPARFVRVDALPRDELGKVPRAALARMATPMSPTERAPSADRDQRIVTIRDGQRLAVRDVGADDAAPGRPVVVLLHATLSTSAQLRGLARRLAERARVLLIDRRGSGDSPMPVPAPVAVERHAADVLETLEALRIDRAVLVGHSFGGVVAIRAAIADPTRVTGLFVWEPPYLALAEPAVQAGMRAMTADVEARYHADGPPAAARRFLEGVSGSAAWDRLHPRQREVIGREGGGVLADVLMGGLTVDGLSTIVCPAIIATGAASDPFYRPIADALAERIGARATRVDLAGLRHPAPITDPEPVAELIVRLLPAPTQESAP